GRPPVARRTGPPPGGRHATVRAATTTPAATRDSARARRAPPRSSLRTSDRLPPRAPVAGLRGGHRSAAPGRECREDAPARRGRRTPAQAAQPLRIAPTSDR